MDGHNCCCCCVSVCGHDCCCVGFFFDGLQDIFSVTIVYQMMDVITVLGVYPLMGLCVWPAVCDPGTNARADVTSQGLWSEPQRLSQDHTFPEMAAYGGASGQRYECGHTLVTYCSEPGIHRGNEDSRGNENRKSRNNIFSVEKNWQAYFFFSMKIKVMDLWMQIVGTKLIFVMNFSVLYFFKLPPEYLKLHRFWSRLSKFSLGGGRGGGGMPP